MLLKGLNLLSPISKKSNWGLCDHYWFAYLTHTHKISFQEATFDHLDTLTFFDVDETEVQPILKCWWLVLR